MTYLRFGTYAILLVCALIAHRVGYIPVTFSVIADDTLEYDRDFYHGGLAPAKDAGFEDTSLSGSDLMRRVKLVAQENKIDVSEYGDMRISLQRVSGILRWYVTYEAKDRKNHYQMIRFFIDDASGKACVEKDQKKA